MSTGQSAGVRDVWQSHEDKVLVGETYPTNVKNLISDPSTEPSDVGGAAQSHTTCCGIFAQHAKDIAHTVMPYGGYVSSVFTLCTVTLGGGIIGMPSAFHTSGILMAVFYLVVVTLLTVYSMMIIGFAMQKTGFDTFETMAYGLFGRGGDYFVGFVMWLSCVGTAIAYISGVSSLVTPILEHEGMPHYLQTKSGNYLITSLVWLCFMCPVVIPKRVNSLRYVSAFSVVFVMFFVIAVVVHSCQNGLSIGMRDDMRLMNTEGPEAVDGLAIFIFAYMCQGVTYPVYFEMRPKPSVRKLTISTAIAMGICMFFYFLAGFFGYMDFGSEVKSSILFNYNPIEEPLMMVAYIGILIKLCTAYAMNMVPIRNFTYYILQWDLDTVSYWKHVPVILFISTVVLVCGLFIPSIDFAFGLVGALCGGFIAFIFPALFWMYCGRWTYQTVGPYHWLSTYFLLICGVVAIVFGTGATFYYATF